MLLQFSTDNYKNFANGFTFSMRPNPHQTDLAWSIQSTEAGGTTHKALSSAVVYGPNAAGKSNILGALDTLKCIVQRGNVKNTTKLRHYNYAGDLLELIPNRHLSNTKPVMFGIEFITAGMMVDYSFRVDMGGFLSFNYPRRVVSEKLMINGTLIFERAEKEFTFGNFDALGDDIWGDHTERRLERAELSAEVAEQQELFLMNGFRTSVGPRLVSKISDWLDNRLIVLPDSHLVQFSPHLRSDESQDGFLVSPLLTQTLALVSANAGEVGYSFDPNGVGRMDMRLDTPNGLLDKQIVPAEFFESYGSIRLLNILPYLLHALQTGGTLLMDEFDASLHPAIAQGIISTFHNDEANPNQAQLIVNTHSLGHMSSQLYRRDEIHLVDLDREAHSSDHYTLADFKTYSGTGVRKNESYMRKYLKEAFGAYPDTDMEQLLSSLVNGSNDISSENDPRATDPAFE